MPKIIWTCFAGRERNLAIQLRYLKALHLRGLIDEVHLWDFTRNAADSEWIMKNFGDDKHPFIKRKHVENKKKWGEYYMHYTSTAYPDHIIIKCDDDVVYIDVEKFPKFINNVVDDKDDTHMVYFPSIINNGVCAYLQQQDGLLPEKELGVMPYDTFCGRLWGDGKLAERVHLYFIKNINEMRAKQPDRRVTITRGDRISINFFAIKTSKLHIYQAIGPDDEAEITVRAPPKFGLDNVIDLSMFVAHLGFYKQRSTGMNEVMLLEEYAKLADRLYMPKTF